MEKFTLINKDRSRIKVSEPFEDVSKHSINISAMIIPETILSNSASKTGQLIQNQKSIYHIIMSG